MAKPIKTSFRLTVGFKIPQYGHCLFFASISFLQFLQVAMIYPLKFFEIVSYFRLLNNQK
jgi:hypothetical protein